MKPVSAPSVGLRLCQPFFFSLSPVWVMALRLLLGAALLYAILRLRGDRLPDLRGNALWFLWLGAIGSVLPFFLISWGSLHIASGLVGIMMALVPLVTITLAHVLLPDEPLNRSKSFGFIIGFIGLTLLVGPQFLADITFSGLATLAQAAVLAAAALYALQTVTARLSPEMTPLQKSTGVLVAAALQGLAVAIVLDPFGLSEARVEALAATLMLGVFATALAALLLFQLVDRAGASFVSISNYLIPPFAYFLGILALGEELEMRALLGLAIILAGVYVAEKGTPSLR
jgi:drug/metabolite transporter (DMT)-like permease